MTPTDYSVVKADKDLFAVYQTIYSNADTNLQFDWHSRLDDTKWTDECYFVLQGSQKIGGILILEDTTRFAFLITPFNDRDLFWRIIHNHIRQNNLKITKMYSVLDCDVHILLSYGYKIEMSRRMMCRPTDCFDLSLDDRYYYQTPCIDKDIDKMIVTLDEGYKNGIDYEVFGAATYDEIRADVASFLNMYNETGTLSQSTLVFEKQTDTLAAVCVAGKNPESRSYVSGIADIAVLPEHNKRGLAEFMIKRALTEGCKTSQVMELCVTVGNTAENLYRKMGFWGGPRFTSMILR